MMRMLTETSDGVTVGDTKVTDLDFADDVLICSEGWLLVTRVPGSYIFELSIVEEMVL